MHSESMRRQREERILQAEGRKLVARLFGFRALFIPVVALGTGTAAYHDPSPLRRALVLGPALAFLPVALFEFHRARGGAVSVDTLPRRLAFMAVVLTVVMLGTGGAESPFLLPLLPLAFALTILGTERLSRGVRALFSAALLLHLGLLLRLSPAAVLPPYLHGGGGLTMAALRTGIVVLGLFALGVLGGILRESFLQLWSSRAQVESLVLEQYAQEQRALGTLAAEIAHELKNPLASVKGLAALLERESEALSPKGRERLLVLQREVQRMQRSLEEFLDLSRPLLPVSCAPVELGALGEEVLTLHEGLAAEKGVRLALDAQPGVVASCDRRKVRQVLVNLVQNALAASPSGGTLTVEVRGGEEAVELRVRDQGPGLPEALAARVFEAGVTGKPDGSGLGLTLARSLARQHGGELELASSAAGCVATMTLPRVQKEQSA